MSTQSILGIIAIFLISFTVSASGQTGDHTLSVQQETAIVFQAAGPDAASIQSAVDQFRAALGENNGGQPGPIADGRREINWDGGGSTATVITPNPFDGFLVNRGARFTTNGTGFVLAPVSGIADTFGNISYNNIFTAFSPVRLFSAIGSNLTNTYFFVPGGGEIPASTRGFGAVFTDVDRPNGNGRLGFIGHLFPSTRIDYFDARGRLLHSGVVPASPGDGGLSFLGIVLDDARIYRVRITSGSHAPGPDDTSKKDIVMMDDFIYGEPQLLGQ